MTPSLMTRARDYLSIFSNKFFKEGLPIALASAIGALVVGQFNNQTNKPPVPPAIIVQAAPAAAPAAPAEPERVVDQVKRDSEGKRTATVQETNAKPTEERRPRQVDARQAEPRHAEPRPIEKTAKLPVKQIPERKVATVDPQPLTSAAPAPLPAPTASVPVEGRDIGEWVTGALPLPTRVTGATDRSVDDAPVPPLPVPLPYDQVGTRM